jgi:hypothetical protein
MKLLRLNNIDSDQSRFNAYIQNPIQIKKGGKIALKHLTMDVVPKDFNFFNDSIQIKVGQNITSGGLINDFYKYISLPNGEYSQSNILQIIQYGLNSSLDGSYYYKLSVNIVENPQLMPQTGDVIKAGTNTIRINKSENIFNIGDNVVILYYDYNLNLLNLETEVAVTQDDPINANLSIITLQDNFEANSKKASILQSTSFPIECEDVTADTTIITLKNKSLLSNYVNQGDSLVFNFELGGIQTTAVRQVTSVGGSGTGIFEINEALNDVTDAENVSFSVLVVKAPQTKTDVGMQFSTSTDSSGNLVISFNRSDQEIGTTDTTTNLNMTQTQPDYFESTVANTLDDFGSFAQFKVPGCKGGFHNEIEIKSSVGGTIQPNGTRIYTQARYLLTNTKLNTNLAPTTIPKGLSLVIDYFSLPINANNFINGATNLVFPKNFITEGYFAENVLADDYFVVEYTNPDGLVKRIPKQITNILYGMNTTTLTVGAMGEAGSNVKWSFMGYKYLDTVSETYRLFNLDETNNDKKRIFPKSGDVISISRNWYQSSNSLSESVSVPSSAFSDLKFQILTHTIDPNDPDGIPSIFNPLSGGNIPLFNSSGFGNNDGESTIQNLVLLQDYYCTLITAETKPNTATSLFKISQYADPTITQVNDKYVRIHPANTQNVVHDDNLGATASLVSLYIPDLSTQQLLGYNTSLYTQNAVSGSFPAENNLVQNVVDDDVIVELTNIPFESFESTGKSGKQNGRKNYLYVLTRQDFNESTLNNRFDSDIQYPIFMDINNENTISINSFSVYIHTATGSNPFNLLGQKCSLVLLVEDPV